MNLADRVHAFLKPSTPSLTNYRLIVDSALFLIDPVFKPLPCKHTFYCSVKNTYKQGVEIWKSKLD